MNKLTAADKKFIGANYSGDNIGQLAAAIGKDEVLVEDYLRGISTKPKTKSRSLRDIPEWVFLSEQYVARELAYMDTKYEEYLGQLDYDMEPTERKQLLQMIETDVMMQRNKTSRKRLIDLINDIDKRLKKAIADKDNAEIDRSQQELSSLNNLSTGSYRELTELQKKHDDLMKQLDSTREQRLKNAVATKHSWTETLAMWMDKKHRAKQEKITSIMRKATEIETDRLANYHTYSDGMIDQPILNHNTIKEDHI